MTTLDSILKKAHFDKVITQKEYALEKNREYNSNDDYTKKQIKVELDNVLYYQGQNYKTIFIRKQDGTVNYMLESR